MLETGTTWVQALAAPSVRHSLFIVRITQAETVAAITRRERGGTITPQDAATAVADFQRSGADRPAVTTPDRLGCIRRPSMIYWKPRMSLDPEMISYRGLNDGRIHRIELSDHP